jgi:hypothetical protein
MKRFIVLLLVCCLGAAVTARPIRGTVKCAGTPVSGVTVTDGHSFTESGADGTFTLDADDDALFISIVTPSGYLAPMEQDIPQFFRPYAASTKRYDFELRPWPATGEVYELLAIGDPQPKTAAHFDRLRRSSPNCNARPPSGSNGARHRRRCCSATSSGTLRSCSPASASSSHRSEYRSTA